MEELFAETTWARDRRVMGLDDPVASSRAGRALSEPLLRPMVKSPTTRQAEIDASPLGVETIAY